MTDAFFLQEDDDRFISTEWTIGPWSNESQHAGPPAALLGRAIEAAVRRDDAQVARITLEILRPVPVAPLQVRAEVVRPGRSVILTSASLSDERGVVVQAHAWSIRLTELGLDEVVHGDDPPAGPEDGAPVELFPVGEQSYLTAMEWRFVRGSFLEPGPATAWARMRYPLVEGEEVTPLSRVLILADSGNGISAAMDFDKWVFINPDLSVYLHRLPRGEWVCLDAQTSIEPTGIGLATSTLSDAGGVIGRGLQSLFIGPRG
ncbi:MAG TPA: thioesterase family protein [Actinomycetota bacterium]|nr:thioesterase family protein [Actinomycetota bacterium]